MLAATGLVALACGTATVGARPPSTATTAQPSPDVNCPGLQVRGISPCPPSGLPAEQIVVRNGTHGAVPDDVVRTQGRAYIRAHTLYDWAVRQRDGGAFLMSGALVPPEIARTNVFRTEVRVLSDARASGGSAHIEPLRTTEITLVPVPVALQEAARSDGLRATQFAWVDNQAGPARVTVQAPGGAAREVLRIAPGEPHPILVFGEVRQDADLGPIWYLGGEYGCLASPQVRVVCGL
jgi:hypothetical protein